MGRAAAVWVGPSGLVQLALCVVVRRYRGSWSRSRVPSGYVETQTEPFTSWNRCGSCVCPYAQVSLMMIRTVDLSVKTVMQ